jgi:hypothetical protein
VQLCERVFVLEPRRPPASIGAQTASANGVLVFLTDRQVIENAQENERELGGEFGGAMPDDPTAEQAWEYVDALWSGDPGGRMWHVRVPEGATWLALRDDEHDPRAGGPEPTFGFGEPPLGERLWGEPGY